MFQPYRTTPLCPLCAHKSEVRGFGQHSVGGANPAESPWAKTLINACRALHDLELNIHAPPLHQWVYSDGKVVSALHLFISV